MFTSTLSITVAVLLLFQVYIASAKIAKWTNPYYRQYGDDGAIASIGLCLITPVLAYKIGVAKGEDDNDDSGLVEYTIRECALQALLCGGSANTDCSNCLQIQNTADCDTSINGCTASVGFCRFTCPTP
ncbi:uncharacterized protein [Argopecten irradians]|uniref:uncharacterized protein n=1 Tax=Argopecten irradians TaxID=31199 RepID=UPI0037234A8F